MKRFLVFAYDLFAPLGGWNDFVGDYSTLTSAIESLENNDMEEGHIVDTKERKIVYNFELED